MRRLRLGTMILLVIIIGQGIALFIQERQARRRINLLNNALSLYRDRAEEEILEKLEGEIQFYYTGGDTLGGILKQVRSRTKGIWLPTGIPIYFDPVGLQEAEVSLDSPLPASKPRGMAPLGDQLREFLKPYGLVYQVRDGLMTITSKQSLDEPIASPKDWEMRQQDLFRKYRDVLE